MSRLFQRITPKQGVILFFICLLLIGWITAPSYGYPCDEQWEQQILQENMYEYALQLFGEESDMAQFYEGKEIDPISLSTEKDHGQCAYYLFVPILHALEETPTALFVAWRLYTWLWFMLALLSLYHIVRKMGASRLIACITVLMLLLCPRFFAEGHYNNKDMVLFSLVFATLWMGLKLLQKPSIRIALLFSLLGAMATNTKIIGIAPWGLMGLCILALITARKQWTKQNVCIAIIAVVSFGAFYVLLTPAIWQDPLGYLLYLWENATSFTRWPGVVVFRAMTYQHAVNPLPFYYIPFMILSTTPPYVLVMIAVGQLFALHHLWVHKKRLLKDSLCLFLLGVTLCWFVPVAYAMIARPLVYNGWRHFYFVFAPLCILMGFGLMKTWQWVKTKNKRCQRIALIALILCMTFTGVQMAINFPHEYSYYNLLGNQNAEEDMELDYWDVSTLEAMQRLIAGERNETIPLTLGALEPMSWFGVWKGYDVLTPEEQALLTIQEDENAPYLYVNTTYARIYGTPIPEGYHTLFTIESYGNTLCTIYEKDAD